MDASPHRVGAAPGGRAPGTGETGVVPPDLDTATPRVPAMIAALEQAARAGGDTGILFRTHRSDDRNERLGFGELHERALRATAGFRALGVEPGDRVLIVMPTSPGFVVAFFAAQMVGAVPVPAYPPMGFQLEAGLNRVAHIARHSGAVVCVTSRKVRPVIGDVVLRAPALRQVVTPEGLASGDAPYEPFRPEGRDRAFIQYTSGSTGQPKGVVVTHGNVVSNIHAIGRAIEARPDDVLVSWCPLYHDMGLVGALLYCIYWQTPTVLISPTLFLARPEEWLQAIHDHGGTLSPAPNFGYALAVKRVPPERRDGWDLSSWRVAFNGAEPVNPATVEAFIEVYAPHGFRPGAMFPVYGLAEATLAVAFPDLGRGVRTDRVDRRALAVSHRAEPAPADAGEDALELVSVGKAIPEHDLAVVDREGRRLPERAVGHVVAAGPSVMEGYLDDRGATGKVLRDGWLWTGDLGYVSEGELFITGRAKDVLIRHGRKYTAEELELAAESVAGVRKGRSVAFAVYDDEAARDRIVLVCESRVPPSARGGLADRIDEAVQQATGVPPDEILVVAPGTIPRTSSGKRQRSRCRELYLRGELDPGREALHRRLWILLRSGVGFLVLRFRKRAESGPVPPGEPGS